MQTMSPFLLIEGIDVHTYRIIIIAAYIHDIMLVSDCRA